MIKEQTTEYPEKRIEVFSKYHDTLFSTYEEKLKGEKAVIFKLLHYWEYFATCFSNPKKIVKKIKKTKTIEAYDKVVKEILDHEKELSFETSHHPSY